MEGKDLNNIMGVGEFSIESAKRNEDYERGKVHVKKKKNYIVSSFWNTSSARDGLVIKFNGLSNKEKIKKIRTLVDEYMGSAKWINAISPRSLQRWRRIRSIVKVK